MKYWIYVEPVSEKCSAPVWNVLSEEAILASYYDYWQERMIRANKQDQISEQACIEDWVIIHWATEATPESLLRIINE